MDPVGALIGSILVGFGVVIVYGAVKNKKVFGSGGIVSTALTTGQLANVSEVPTLFTPDGAKTGHFIEPQQTGDTAKGSMTTHPFSTVVVEQAVARIRNDNRALGDRIDNELNNIDNDTTFAGLTTMAQLLLLADAQGHGKDADIIRDYVSGVTNEPI